MITHPEKLLFPADGITKGDVCAYYEAVAQVMLPHIAGRPVTMERTRRASTRRASSRRTSRRDFPPGCGGWRSPDAPAARTTGSCTTRSSTMRAGWSGWRTRTRSRRTSGPRACRSCTTPMSASSISTLREDEPAKLRAAALAVRDLLRRARPGELRQDVGLEGVPHRRRAGRPGRLRAGAALLAGCRRRAGEAPPGAVHAGVHQGRSRRPDLRRHRPQRSGRHLRRGLRRAPEARRARLGALHLGRGRERRGRSPDVHPANVRRPPRRGRRSLAVAA